MQGIDRLCEVRCQGVAAQAFSVAGAGTLRECPGFQDRVRVQASDIGLLLGGSRVDLIRGLISRITLVIAHIP